MPCRDPLRLAVAQPPTTAGDLVETAAAHADAVRRAGASVVVFPETSLTGYDLAAPAVDPAEPALAPLVAACAGTGTTALAGAIVDGPDGTGRSIGVLGVDGTGVRVVYRKQWPGADEVAAGIVPGPGPVALDVDGWRLGLGVCRDTGIPEHAAATAALGIDVYVAGLVHHEDEADEQERRAARITSEHGVWVALAGFAGPTGEGYERTSGRSAIWAPDGRCLARAGSGAGDVAVATLAAP